MNKQVIYYTVSFILGNIIGYIFFNSFIMAMVSSIIIILVMFLTLNFSNFIIWMGFFIIGITSFYMFFNINLDNKPLKVRIEEVNGYYVKASYKGRNVALTDYTRKINTGDYIELEGTLDKDINYSNGNLGIIKNYKILNIKKDTISRLYELRVEIKNKFQNSIGKNRGAIVTGVAFGDLKGASEEQKEEFKQLGIIHSISVSGFHLNLIYGFLESIIGTLGGMIVTLIYVIFTGAKASSLRAFVMIFFLKLSTKVYKKYNPVSILAFTALILGFYRPYYIFNAGFHLSFLSTLGIALYNKKIDKILYKIPNCIRGTISLTMSSQIFSFPYIVIVFNYFSFGFLLGNLLVMPFISLLVILGNIGLIFSKVNIIFNFLCKIINIIMIIIESLCKILKNISPDIQYMNYKYCIIYCFLIIAFYLYIKGYKKLKYLPIAILISGCFWIHNIYPTIDIHKVGNAYICDISYRWDNIVVIKGNLDDYYTKEKLKYSSRIEETNSKYKVNLDRKYDIILNNEYVYIYSKGCLENKVRLKDGVTVKILPNKILSMGG